MSGAPGSGESTLLRLPRDRESLRLRRRTSSPNHIRTTSNRWIWGVW